MGQQIQLRMARWDRDKPLLAKVRREVFIVEQQVPESLEWDDYDMVSYHILALADGIPIGTGRIKPDGHIGRMAVRYEYRQRGIGKSILDSLVQHALEQLGCKKVYLHAQLSAVGFYEKCGFRVCSDTFMDAGIPHKTMGRVLRGTL